MNVVIIYDIEPIANNNNFRSFLQKNSYYRGWSSSGDNYYLPTSAIYEINTELAAAKSKFLSICDRYNVENPGNQVKLNRLIILPATDWEGITGIDNKV